MHAQLNSILLRLAEIERVQLVLLELATCNNLRQRELLELAFQNRRNQETIVSDLTDLQDKVTAEETVIGSAEALLVGLKTELDAALANNDTAALQALSQRIGDKTTELAAAVAANTPAAAPASTT